MANLKTLNLGKISGHKMIRNLLIPQRFQI